MWQIIDTWSTDSELINKIEAGGYYDVYACDDVSCSARLVGRLGGLYLPNRQQERHWVGAMEKGWSGSYLA